MVSRAFRTIFVLQTAVIFLSFLLFSFICKLFSTNLFASVVISFFISLCISFFIYVFSLAAVRKSLTSLAQEEEINQKDKNRIQTYNRLGTILSRMVEGVIVIDNHEKVLTLSQPLIDMLDLRSRQAVGRSYWEVVRNAEINSLLKETLTKKVAQKRELEILFPQESFFNVQTSPILNDKKEILGVVAVFHDITELKRLEKIRSEFVANVSHELKTPLTSIKGFVETLASGALNDAKSAKKFLVIIQRHTEKLEDLVNDLLSLSSIESKEAKWNFEPLVLREVIHNVVSLYKEKAEQKHQNLAVNIPRDLPDIFADRLKIEQVFSNLIDNAIKFTSESGTITVEAFSTEAFVCVLIKDSGIGIPAEHLPRVFERFYRIDKSRSRDLGGTGLGLAIVKHIIQAHNGKISVESEVDKGSTFSVFLPKAA